MRSAPSPRRAVNKSTNVRIISVLGRVLDTVAPALAERLAVDLFGRPVRASADPPRADGLDAHAFTIRAAGWDLAAWDWGDGPTVVLVHGWSGHAGQMSAFVAPLVAAGHHVLAFDLPGHGRSSGSRVTLPDLARAIDAVLDRVRPARGVIAHSLGATAAALAFSHGLAPERAVLVAPPAEPRPFAHGFARGLGLSDGHAENVVRRLAAEVGPLDSFAAEQVGPRQRTRLLVAHDPSDREVPFAHSERWVASSPAARLLRLEGLGHRRGLRDPAFVRAATSFVAGTPLLVPAHEPVEVARST